MRGKTGTAQKVGDNGGYMQGNYILSFLGAAPMVGDIFEQILQLLNIKKDYKNQIEKELRWYIDTPYHSVPNFINMNKSKIKTSPYYKYLFIGNGNTVIDQEPLYGDGIPEGGTIILYSG